MVSTRCTPVAHPAALAARTEGILVVAFTGTTAITRSHRLIQNLSTVIGRLFVPVLTRRPLDREYCDRYLHALELPTARPAQNAGDGAQALGLLGARAVHDAVRKHRLMDVPPASLRIREHAVEVNLAAKLPSALLPPQDARA